MKYWVLLDYGSRVGFTTFDAALDYYRANGGQLVGDGYDCDEDEDGLYMCSDGLTEDERSYLP